MAQKPTGNMLVDTMRTELVRHLVSHLITCPATGEVLDMDTCVVFVDADGDPAAVVSQTGYRQILAERPATIDILAAKGLTLDTDTVQDNS